MPKVVHFEIPVDDAERAAAFYTGTFGWDVQGWGDQPYWLVTAGAEDEPGADGALIGRGELHTSPVVVVGVASVDETIAAARDAGGEILADKQEVPGVGYAAYLRDSEGNTIGIFEPLPVRES
jgi:uncharacterized protein